MKKISNKSLESATTKGYSHIAFYVSPSMYSVQTIDQVKANGGKMLPEMYSGTKSTDIDWTKTIPAIKLG